MFIKTGDLQPITIVEPKDVSPEETEKAVKQVKEEVLKAAEKEEKKDVQ